MTFEKLSKKQAKVLRWWCEEPIASQYDSIICDGAVRSGKTTVMLMSFILWAMENFRGYSFGICGKTVRSAERNIIMPLMQMEDITAEYQLKYASSVNLLTVSYGKAKNQFYVFGGKDESSYMLIQGITLAGVFFDEVALMPESFVNQAIARTLSVSERRLWFNCNPESPNHWFYTNWIASDTKSAVKLHFTMKDNPILTNKDIQRAESLYSGVFYDRYIKGLWVVAEGLVYPMFSAEDHVVTAVPRPYEKYYVSNDYGTVHPCVFQLYGLCNGIWYLIKEYYHSGSKGRQKTVDEYYSDLLDFTDGYEITQFIRDKAPIAASFNIHLRRKRDFASRDCDNEVLSGIQDVATALKQGLIKINDCCVNTIREFGLYSWQKDSVTDTVIKENDDTLDCLRYFVRTLKIAQIKRQSLL